MTRPSPGWWTIVRLGLVQTAIGSIAVLTTSTLSRVMVVELALPASLPAALVAWHYTVQLSRPLWGHDSDNGKARTPWIVGGMAVLSLGAVLATDATAALDVAPLLGSTLAVIAFTMIGGGVAACGTSLLALLAAHVDDRRRPAAAAVAWVMMILGIVLTAGIAGQFLDPFSPQRLALVGSEGALCALAVALLAVRGVESRLGRGRAERPTAVAVAFKTAMHDIWEDRLARQFTVFVFISMLAYSAQELIIEPYAGVVFGYSLGRSTQLAAFQHGGVLLGMVVAGLSGCIIASDKTALMKRCAASGCVASAIALGGLGLAGFTPSRWPLEAIVAALGLSNGIFAVSAVGLMMSFAGGGRHAGPGARVGLWGAAQAAAFGIGGFVGAFGLDVMRHTIGSGPAAFAVVFGCEAGGFLAAAVIALRLGRTAPARHTASEALASSTI